MTRTAASWSVVRRLAVSFQYRLRLWFTCFSLSLEYARSREARIAAGEWMNSIEAQARTWVHLGALPSPIGGMPSSVPMIVREHTRHHGSKLLAGLASRQSVLVTWPSSTSRQWDVTLTPSPASSGSSSAPAESSKSRPLREIPTRRTPERAISSPAELDPLTP